MSTNQQLEHGVYVEERLENLLGENDFLLNYIENERWILVEEEDNLVLKDEVEKFEDLTYDSQEEFLDEVEDLVPGRYGSIELEDGGLEIYERAKDDAAIGSDLYVDLNKMV